ncbi:TonB-dependent receptor [candidate division WOR-3 bacterium]|nr:TonB-dependent receptor [candidate division WOR-3 bacterium]
MIIIVLLSFLFSVKGYIYSSKNKEFLPNVNVTIIGTRMGSVSDTFGYFEIENIPQREFDICISHIGYRDTIISISMNEKSSCSLNVFLIPKPVSVPGIEIIGERVSIDTREYDSDLLLDFPMGDYDIFRVIRSLPGVSSTSDYMGWLYVRGGRHDENAFLLDNAPISYPYHFLGVFSVLPGDVIKQVHFSPGGFDAAYGNALSALIRFSSKNAQITERKYSWKTNVAGTGFYSEIPVNSDLSYRFFCRRSYIDLLAEMMMQNKEQILIPDYHDIYIRGDWQLSANHSFSLTGLTLNDKASTNLSIAEETEEIYFKKNSNNIILNYRWKFLYSTFFWEGMARELGYGGEKVEDELKNTGGLKIGWEDEQFKFGASIEKVEYQYASESPFDFLFSGWRVRPDIQADTEYTLLSTYLVLNRNITEDLSIILGFRGDYRSLEGKTTIAPRLHLIKELFSSTIYLMWGHFSQFPRPEYSTLSGNSLKPKLAKHFILGFELPVSSFLNIRCEVYDREFVNQPILFKEESNNSGYGYARGIEGVIYGKFGEDFDYWVGLSKSIAKRTGLFDTLFTYFQADVPASFNLNFRYKRNNWTFSTSVAYASGQPFTPIVGRYYNEEKELWYWASGPRNSERMPFYQRIDLKVKRDFRLGSFSGSVYLTGTNILQHRNIQSYVYYLSDFPNRYPIYMMPRFYLVGFTIDF